MVYLVSVDERGPWETGEDEGGEANKQGNQQAVAADAMGDTGRGAADSVSAQDVPPVKPRNWGTGVRVSHSYREYTKDADTRTEREKNVRITVRTASQDFLSLGLWCLARHGPVPTKMHARP